VLDATLNVNRVAAVAVTRGAMLGSGRRSDDASRAVRLRSDRDQAVIGR
jgi:hypothetical protein